MIRKKMKIKCTWAYNRNQGESSLLESIDRYKIFSVHETLLRVPGDIEHDKEDAEHKKEKAIKLKK